MRKLLCFILAFTMIFTSVASYAAMSTDKIPEFLDSIGVLSKNTLADETKVVTRGEFATMIADLVTINNMQNLSDVQIFKDIPVDHELFNVTTLLNKLYFIVGDGNGYFEPDENITIEQVCKILVHLMGDQYFAEYYGGYIPAAASKGILNGVELAEGSTVTAKAARKLIYNLLVADISNSNMYDGNATVINPEKEMFMSKRLGIFKVDGRVTDDGVTGLTGVTEIPEGDIKIGQYVFKNNTGMTDLLGYTVEGFYKYDEATDKNILLYAYVNDNVTDVIEIADVKLDRYSNYTYEYFIDEDNFDVEEAYLNPNFKLIYNGRAYTKDTAESSFVKTIDEMLMPDSGWVKLIDTDGDSYYDLVMVKDYEILVLSSVDLENYVVYGNPEITDTVIDLKGSEEDVHVFDSKGYVFDLASLDRGDVLSIAESADGKHVEIMYSPATVEGTLGSIDGNKYYIGEEVYTAVTEFSKYANSVASTGNALVPGVYGTFYLTFDGRIAFFKSADEAATKAGLLGNLLCKSNIDDELQFYLMTDSGSFDELKAAKKVTVDGVVWKDMYALSQYLAPFNKGLILYRLNKDDEINWIDTPYDAVVGNPNAATESDDSLHIVKNGNRVDTRFNKGQLSFNGKFLMDSSAIQFVTYETEEFEKSVIRTFASLGSTNTNLTVTAYSTDTDSMFVDYIVRYASRSTASAYQEAPVTAVVLKISDTLNDEGEPIKKLLVTDNGTHYKDIYAEPQALICKCGKGGCATKPLEVGVGDIIQYALTNNTAYDTIICYDYSQKKLVSPGNLYYFGTVKNGTFSGTGHSWDPSWIDTMTREASYYSTSKTTVLPVNYINRIESQAAEWAFGFWPFTDRFETSSGNLWVNEQTSEETSRRYSMSSTYAIRVNPQKGTFTPMRLADIKTYNNGAGVKEQGYVVWKSGTPILLIYYK